MTIWLDNHMSPALARWIAEAFSEPCVQIRDLGLARAQDREIFDSAKSEARVFVTKDRDFEALVARFGPPLSIILLSCGNTSTAYLRNVLSEKLAAALRLIGDGEPLVEIGAPTSPA